MTTRKLQTVGGGTFTVSLPKEWAREEGLSAGDPVTVRALSDGVVVVEPPADAGDGGDVGVGGSEGGAQDGTSHGGPRDGGDPAGTLDDDALREAGEDATAGADLVATVATDRIAPLERVVRAAYAVGATRVVLEASDGFTTAQRDAVAAVCRTRPGLTDAEASSAVEVAAGKGSAGEQPAGGASPGEDGSGGASHDEERSEDPACDGRAPAGEAVVVRSLLDPEELSVRQSVRHLQFLSCSRLRAAVDALSTAAQQGDSESEGEDDGGESDGTGQASENGGREPRSGSEDASEAASAGVGLGPGSTDDAARHAAVTDRALERTLASLTAVDDVGEDRPTLLDYSESARALASVARAADRLADTGPSLSRPGPVADLASRACSAVEAAIGAVLEETAGPAHRALDVVDEVRDGVDDLLAGAGGAGRSAPTGTGDGPSRDESPGGVALGVALAAVRSVARAATTIARRALRAVSRRGEDPLADADDARPGPADPR